MSQTDGQTKTIGPDTYKVLMLDPLVASDLLVDLGRVFGPALAVVGATLIKSEDSKAALGQLLDGHKTEGSQDGASDLLGDNLEGALVGLIDRIEKDKLREIIGILQEVTSVKKGNDWPPLSSIFSMHFRGRLKSMYQWLGFALRVQFRDFF